MQSNVSEQPPDLLEPPSNHRTCLYWWEGIPDEVSEVALLEVAHFERQRINVRGGVAWADGRFVF